MPPLCYARPCRAPVTSGMAALAGMQRRHGRRTPLSAICHLLSCGSVAVHSRVGRASLRRCTARNYGESDQILPRVTDDHGRECGGRAAALLRAAMPRGGDERHGRSCRKAAAAWPPHSVVFSRADLLPYIRASVGVRFGFAPLVITAKAIKYFRA